jgi:hypothetical protein
MLKPVLLGTHDWRPLDPEIGRAHEIETRKYHQSKVWVTMPKYDVTKTNLAIERLLEVTENPRHRFLLQPKVLSEPPRR